MRSEQTLPDNLDPNRGFKIVAEPRAMAVSGPILELDSAPSGVPVSHYWWLLKRQWWRIGLFVLACLGVTWAVTARMTPIYESTATVDIDRQTPQGVIGQDAVRTNLNDSDQFLATQIRLVQSDSVLRPVAAKYDLLRHEEGGTGAASATGITGPVQLKRLKITRPPNTYLLLISYRSPDPQLAADVANGVAQSYLEHTFHIRYKSSANLSEFMEKQLDELRTKMEQSSAAVTKFERDLNVVSPEEKTSILSARLLQLNTEYTAAQADRVRKEASLASVRNGSLEAAQASSQGESLRKLIDHSNESKERFAEIQAHFGVNHPEYRKAAEKAAEIDRQIAAMKQTIAKRVETEYQEAIGREQMLRKTVADTKAEFDSMNSRSFDYQSVKREAEADKKLYEELVRKIKEAGINASFQNSAIRIADPARPATRPVSPSLKLNLLAALIVSLFASFLIVVASDALDTTIRDPEQAARTLGTDIVGSLPMVRTWHSRLGLPGQASPIGLVRAGAEPPIQSGYMESIRTLRNSILLPAINQRLRSILVTSASTGEGKSTMAAHLAVSHAGQNHRTLLIDGDLRRPTVHKRFKIDGSRGLTNVLTGEIGWKEAITEPQNEPGLWVLPAGPPSRRPGDVTGPQLQRLMDEALSEFDLVILDGPPLLGFAEPLQMATIVDGVLVVTRAGSTNRKQVAAVIGTLRRLRANVIGVVLNQVHKGMSETYAYYGQYGKYYAQRAAS